MSALPADGPVRLGIVGLGWWGLTMIRTLQDSDKVDVVAGVDPDPVRRGEATALSRRLITFPSLEDLVASGEVEAVVLCTPHPAHAEQVVAAAEAGLHVFCEKPFTVSSEEARRALAAVESAGVQVGIGHEKRFEQPIIEMRRAVADGVLGVPLVFEGNFSQDKFLSLPPDNWRLSNALAPVGPLSATGIHLMDLSIAIFGRPVEVWARLATLATSFANGDTLSVSLSFDTGASATLTASLTTPFIGRTCLLGSEGWMEVRDRSHPESPNGWDTVLHRRGREPEVSFVPPDAPVRSNLEAFADAVRGVSVYPVTPEEIQANVDTFEAISRSAGSGQVEKV